jgi:hypothetical protein
MLARPLELYLQVLFALVILEIGSCFLLSQSWTEFLLFYASHHSWDDRQENHHAQLFFLLRWVLVNFFVWALLELCSS